MKRLIPALAALSLAACATAPTVYQPASAPTAVGYSDYRIEPGRYRITFRGGPGAGPQRVMDLALVRAADLTLADGYEWFRVTDRFVQGLPDRSPRIGLGMGGGDYGRRSSVGIGLGTSFSLGGGPASSATLEVLMGKGARPAGADIYDARALRENLGAGI